MNTLDAVALAEGYVDPDPAQEGEDIREAWQLLVDTGLAWKLQGWFGRTAMRMIRDGELAPPENWDETP